LIFTVDDRTMLHPIELRAAALQCLLLLDPRAKVGYLLENTFAYHEPLSPDLRVHHFLSCVSLSLHNRACRAAKNIVVNIDEPTLMMVLGLVSITASAMFFTLHASARHIPGVRLWALGSLSVGAAVILDAPRLIKTWQWASLLFNIPFSVGQALFLVETAQFVGRPCARHTFSLLVAIAVVVTTVFTLFFLTVWRAFSRCRVSKQL
jgi:hypothetical protein